MAVIEKVSGKRVSFTRPRRMFIAPYTLREEVNQKLEPVSIEVTCGIVGKANSGKKHLGDRFERMNEGVIEEIKKVDLCYQVGLKMVLRGKIVDAVVRVCIIPPAVTTEEVAQNFISPHLFSCLLFAFDVTKKDSFCAVAEFIRQTKKPLPTDYFFVGTKSDLREAVPKRSVVSRKTARMLALQLGAKDYFECSAKHNTNVEDIMKAIVRCEWEQNYA